MVIAEFEGPIVKIQVYNRHNCCWDRWKGAILKVDGREVATIDSDGDKKYQAFDVTVGPGNHIFTFSTTRIGHDETLNIGEIKLLRDGNIPESTLTNTTEPPDPSRNCPSGIGDPILHQGLWWVPVVKIENNHEHRSRDAIANKKLSDADINSNKTDGSLFWLKCGKCDTYFQSDKEWNSEGTSQDGQSQNMCNIDLSTGPFSEGDSGNCHAGADCWRSGGAIYNDCGNKGCNCRHGGNTGFMYLQCPLPAAASGSTAGHSVATAQSVASPIPEPVGYSIRSKCLAFLAFGILGFTFIFLRSIHGKNTSDNPSQPLLENF